MRWRGAGAAGPWGRGRLLWRSALRADSAPVLAAGLAPKNSLRELRSLRSNSFGESETVAFVCPSAHKRQAPPLRASPPQKAPPAPRACRARLETLCRDSWALKRGHTRRGLLAPLMHHRRVQGRGLCAPVRARLCGAEQRRAVGEADRHSGAPAQGHTALGPTTKHQKKSVSPSDAAKSPWACRCAHRYREAACPSCAVPARQPRPSRARRWTCAASRRRSFRPVPG